MNELEIYYKLKESYESSTHNSNKFIKALDSIEWESKFFADDEFYFIKGGLTFTTTSLNPFEVTRQPEAMFSDGSIICF